MGKLLPGLFLAGYLIMAIISRNDCLTLDDIVNRRPNPEGWATGLMWPVNFTRQEEGLNFWEQISQCPVERRPPSATA